MVHCIQRSLRTDQTRWFNLIKIESLAVVSAEVLVYFISFLCVSLYLHCVSGLNPLR